jgi:hypothetical protein
MVSMSAAHMNVVREVAALGLRDCWIAAGFVRSLVWDRLHDRPVTPLPDDIDVVYFDPADASPERDACLQQTLRQRCGWAGVSVKNQARMATRNRHRHYLSTADAMSFWPETCTAVGVAASDRRNDLILCAPFGTHDLTSLLVRPTGRDPETIELARRRIADKRWLDRWPRLQLAPELRLG